MKTEPHLSLRARNLGKVYRSGDSDLVVLRGLDLDVRAGERLAVVGESGSGKSTLLHLLGALDRPTEGSVRFGDVDIFALPEAERAQFRNRNIGFVWQVQSLLPEFTALENVMMPLLIRGEAPGEAAERARLLLAEVGLEARVTHRGGELSGGEQQRVALARALAGAPRVLLADEPTGNLDAKTGEIIINLLDELHKRHRFTAVVVTHNLSFARRCDRVLQLRKVAIRPEGGAATQPETGRNDGREYV